jgi:adenosylmethionine-8-amino-7-oxononanoate aminotransferase
MMTIQSHKATYSGHPAACAIGLQRQDFIETEDLLEASRAGDCPYDLASSKMGSNVAGKAYHAGTWLALELVTEKEPLAPTPHSSQSVTDIDRDKSGWMMPLSSPANQVLSSQFLITEDKAVTIVRLSPAASAASALTGPSPYPCLERSTSCPTPPR